MKKFSFISIILVLVLILTAGCTGQQAAPPAQEGEQEQAETPEGEEAEDEFNSQILFNGSSTLAPVIASISTNFIEGYVTWDKVDPSFPEKNIAIYVSAGGSGQGVKSVIDKTSDFGMVARTVKDSEKEQLPELQEFLVGIDALTLGVNPNNPVLTVKDNLTKDEIVKIFSGEYKTWKDLDASLPDKEIIVVHDGFVSFSAAKNGICDFHISSKPYEAFHEKEAKLPSLNNTFVLEQVIKYLRYYYSVSGNRTMDKVYTYGICDEKINEAIKAVLHINSIIIDSLSCLPKENLPGDFEPSMYFNNVLAFFSNNKELAKNTNYKIKLKKGLAYAAIISIIAAATSLLSGFINTRAAIKDEMSKMTSYIDDEKNFEIYREIEKIKSQSEYLMLYLSRAEELKLEMERNDYMDTSIIREIGKLKPFETKITSIHSDKEGIQLLCLSPSMNEAALFFSHLRGLARVEGLVKNMLDSKKKPERISISRIGSKLGIRALLEKHLNKLPRTKAYLDSVKDSGRDFRIRRIKWAIQELEKEGQELKEWRILRKAGIRKVYQENIEIELENLIGQNKYFK
jgi:hypothetical protein